MKSMNRISLLMPSGEALAIVIDDLTRTLVIYVIL
jgi:hypothetical protein